MALFMKRVGRAGTRYAEAQKCKFSHCYDDPHWCKKKLILNNSDLRAFRETLLIGDAAEYSKYFIQTPTILISAEESWH